MCPQTYRTELTFAAGHLLWHATPRAIGWPIDWRRPGQREYLLEPHMSETRLTNVGVRLACFVLLPHGVRGSLPCHVPLLPGYLAQGGLSDRPSVSLWLTRQQRSRVYQKAMEAAVRRALHHDEVKERKRQKKLAKGLPSTAATPATTTPGTPVRRYSEKSDAPPSLGGTTDVDVRVDPERGEVNVRRKWWTVAGWRKAPASEEEHEKIRPSLRDVNPFPPMVSIFHSSTNALILVCSGTSIAVRRPAHIP